MLAPFDCAKGGVESRNHSVHSILDLMFCQVVDALFFMSELRFIRMSL